MFLVDQFRQIVSAGESRVNFMLVLIHATDDVIREPNIKNTVLSVGHYIHIEVSHRATGRNIKVNVILSSALSLSKGEAKDLQESVPTASERNDPQPMLNQIPASVFQTPAGRLRSST